MPLKEDLRKEIRIAKLEQELEALNTDAINARDAARAGERRRR